MIYVIGPKEVSPYSMRADVINTTSTSKKAWSKELSPFFLGPVRSYDDLEVKNVENLWQFAKVYDSHADSEGNPTPEYFAWRNKGWADSYAHRYPMGKGAKPMYSFWSGEKLDYIQARKKIYIPYYAQTVVKTAAYQRLKDMVAAGQDVWLWDFDGWDYRAMGISLTDVLNITRYKMGHAFVLAMLLEGMDLSTLQE